MRMLGTIEAIQDRSALILPEGLAQLAESDTLVMDKHQRIIGRIIGSIGESHRLRYVLLLDDSLDDRLLKSIRLEEPVFFYTEVKQTDPKSPELEETELNLNQLKMLRRGERLYHKTLLKDVIERIKDMRIADDSCTSTGNNPHNADQLSHRSPSISSLIRHSKHLKAKYRSIKEKLKKQRYQKSKHKIINPMKFQEDWATLNENNLPHEEIFNEIELGKRSNCEEVKEHRSNFKHRENPERSSDSSRFSHISDGIHGIGNQTLQDPNFYSTADPRDLFHMSSNQSHTDWRFSVTSETRPETMMEEDLVPLPSELLLLELP